MENQLLAVFVGISVAFTIVQQARVYHLNVSRGWLVVSFVTAGMMAVTFLLQPDWTGWVGLVFWLLLAIIPTLLLRFSERLFAQEYYDTAIHVQQVIRLLHPFDQNRALPDITRAHQLTADGDIEGAMAIFRRHTHDPQWGFFANTELYRLHQQHEALLGWLRANITEVDYKRNIRVLDTYLRALGRVGDLNTMLSEFARLRPKVEHLAYVLAYNYLMIFTHCGREAQVRALLESTLANLPQNTKKFRLAITDFAAGRTEEGQQRLDELLALHDAYVSQSARLLQDNLPVVAQDVLTPESRELLARFEQDFERMQQSVKGSAVSSKATFVTWIIMALNVAVFVVELLQGGSENLNTLFSLGALWPPAVLQSGEWWRVLSAIFLHFGLLHLAVNMLALYRVGQTLERMMGWLRFAIVYFGVGIGSSLVVLAATQANAAQFGIYLGASGAIMGLVGALAAVALHDWRAGAQRASRGEFMNIIIIVALQFGIDLFVPQLSLVGHLSGAVIGFLVALALLWLRRPSPR